MPVRALRGATTAPGNSRQAILEATGDLLRALMEANGFGSAQVISAVFTATEDLNAAYPAEAARELGWNQAALMCLQEMRVEGGLPRCLRVMVLVETETDQSDLVHRYLGGAAALRPDLTDPSTP